MATATSPSSGAVGSRRSPEPVGVLSTPPAAQDGAAPRCRDCGRRIPPPLSRCRRRTCPGYAPLWAGDQRQKLFANLNAYADRVPSGVREPRVLVSAVTAPGVRGGMEWDEHHCAHLGPHEHSGELGCRVKSGAASPWNESAARRWRDLHRQAYQRCKREGLAPRLLVRVWEMQKRGVLHVHPVLACSTPAEKAAGERYLKHLAELAPRYGFGYVERKRRVRHPRAAAAYLSSYFINGKGSKISLEESVQSNWMPRSIIHVSNELTRASGITMRTLRLRRYAWMLWRQTDINVWKICRLDAHDLWCAFRQDVTLTELVASALYAGGCVIQEIGEWEI